MMAALFGNIKIFRLGCSGVKFDKPDFGFFSLVVAAKENGNVRLVLSDTKRQVDTGCVVDPGIARLAKAFFLATILGIIKETPWLGGGAFGGALVAVMPIFRGNEELFMKVETLQQEFGEVVFFGVADFFNKLAGAQIRALTANAAAVATVGKHTEFNVGEKVVRDFRLGGISNGDAMLGGALGWDVKDRGVAGFASAELTVIFTVLLVGVLTKENDGGVGIIRAHTKTNLDTSSVGNPHIDGAVAVLVAAVIGGILDPFKGVGEVLGDSLGGALGGVIRSNFILLANVKSFKFFNVKGSLALRLVDAGTFEGLLVFSINGFLAFTKKGLVAGVLFNINRCFIRIRDLWTRGVLGNSKGHNNSNHTQHTHHVLEERRKSTENTSSEYS
eukprot:m.49006 g.49006  ORF g.49006 m.49006 type:complete len:388 (-) comp17864_c2_seq2:60-1223(-)